MSGNQRLVLRGGYGLFFDRPNGNTVLNQIGNPPFVSSPVLRWSTLANVASAGLGAGLVTQGTASLTTFQYDAPIPKSAAVECRRAMALPWSSSLDVSYVGQHSWDMLMNVDIDSIDVGAAFLPENQTRRSRQRSTARPRCGSVRPSRRNLTRFGNTGINWNTFHSLQLRFNRRFKNGYWFGVNRDLDAEQQAGGCATVGALHGRLRSRCLSPASRSGTAQEMFGKRRHLPTRCARTLFGTSRTITPTAVSVT